MLDIAELNRLIASFERLCDELDAIRRLIEGSPSPENLQKAIQTLADIHIVDSEIQDVQIEDLQQRVARLEDRLGLSPEPPASGGVAPRIRRE